MTAPAVIAGIDMRISELLTVLEHRAISAVPIVRSGELVGVVSTTDIIAASAKDETVVNRAGDLMSTPVITIRPNDTLSKAARKLAAARVHRLIVVDAGRIVGVLSAHEALEEVKARRIALPLGDVMSSPVATVDIGTSVAEASRALARTNVHGLVVLDDTMPVGVFTHAEALEALKRPPSLRKGPVEEIMSYETICLHVSTPVYRAAAHVSAMDVRRVIVVDKRRVVGIASSLDLLDALPRATTLAGAILAR
jgi:CBS domain-containing protein